MAIQVTAIKSAQFREEDASLFMTLADDAGDECTLELSGSLIVVLAGFAGMATQALASEATSARATGFRHVNKMAADADGASVSIQITDAHEEVHEFGLNERIASTLHQGLRKSLEVLRRKMTESDVEFDGPLAKLLEMRKRGQRSSPFPAPRS